jgi:ABC-2 type transport system permease protein
VLAGGIGVLVSLIASGCGFLTACFARNDGDAANFSMIFIVPLAFLSGSMFPMPSAPLFQLFGRTFQVYDLLPTTHAANALRRVLIYGDNLSDVALEVSVLAAFSLLILLAGAQMYRRLKLS